MKNENSNPVTTDDPLRKLLADAEINSIQLVSGHSAIRLMPDSLSPERVDISIKYDFKTGLRTLESESAREIFCFVTGHLVGKLKNTEDPDYKSLEDGEAFGCECTFVVRYMLSGSENFDQQTFDRLARSQAHFAAYPYIRSYFDLQFTLMGIYGIVLPLLKPKKTKPEVQDQAAK